MGKVVITADMCKSCRYCLTACKKDVIALASKSNRFGYKPVETVNPDACIGCGMCAIMCPEAAIEVYKD